MNPPAARTPRPATRVRTHGPAHPALRRATATALALALLAASLCAVALERDRRQPVEFGADRFDGQIAANGETRLQGNFWLQQGSLRIRADQATLYRTDGALVRVLLDGSPAEVEQELDAGGRMHAQARRIDYRIGSGQLELTGAVVVTQPEGELRGEELRYDLASGQIEGGGSGGVRMRIEPKAPAGH
ncbi:MAG: hypothetical protein KatS3mg126_1251 [Lysobacteraceae bacterium]|nr:MAG: hypothetical protein KatS3mg126_1251 [Xanthomonadaceae bacterium]